MSAVLDQVIATNKLFRRRARVVDLAIETDALEKLAKVLAGSPRRILQSLTDVAMELCQSHSAGVSLLEEGEGKKFFRWHAVSGRWAPLLWATLPREFSPCGTVLDRNSALLMVDPERYFTPLSTVPPHVEEVLLIPFEVAGTTVGTVWVVAHEKDRQFDAADHRIVSKLAKFAAVAYEHLSSMSAEDACQLASMYRAGLVQKHLPEKLIQRKVLVVDDNRDAANLLKVLLEQLGHVVSVAYDGLSALERFHQDRPNLVLLDLMLPGLSGIEVARQIRNSAGAGVQIIAVSGLGSDHLETDPLVFDHRLVKPIEPGFLDSLR